MSALIKAEQDPKGIVVPVGRSARALSCTAAQSVVLYSLLDALLLTNSYYEQPALRTVHSDEYDSFSRVIGAAYDMDPRARTLLLALWRIDSRIEVQKAVADLCGPAIALFEDATLFFKGTFRILIDHCVLPLLHLIASIAMRCVCSLNPAAEYCVHDYYYGMLMPRRNLMTCTIHSNTLMTLIHFYLFVRVLQWHVDFYLMMQKVRRKNCYHTRSLEVS